MLRKSSIAFVVLLSLGSLGCRTPYGGGCSGGCCGGSCGVAAPTGAGYAPAPQPQSYAPTPQTYAPAVQPTPVPQQQALPPAFGGGSGSR